jgi:hypothetical protein
MPLRTPTVYAAAGEGKNAHDQKPYAKTIKAKARMKPTVLNENGREMFWRYS